MNLRTLIGELSKYAAQDIVTPIEVLVYTESGEELDIHSLQFEEHPKPIVTLLCEE